MRRAQRWRRHLPRLVRVLHVCSPIIFDQKLHHVKLPGERSVKDGGVSLLRGRWAFTSSSTPREQRNGAL